MTGSEIEYHDYAGYDFYIASDSENLMDRLNSMMQERGYLSLAEDDGRMHYFIDGSEDLDRTVEQIEYIMAREIGGRGAGPPGLQRRQRARRYEIRRIERFLQEKSISPRLKGFNYLTYLLLELINDPNHATVPDKVHYASICQRFNTGRKQVDRVISYSLEVAGIPFPNSEAIARLLEDYKFRYLDKRKQH
jgi:hypothetical protein